MYILRSAALSALLSGSLALAASALAGSVLAPLPSGSLPPGSAHLAGPLWHADAAAGRPANDDRAYVGTVRHEYRPGTGSVVFVTEGTIRLDYVETDPWGKEHYAPTQLDVEWSVSGNNGSCELSGSRSVSVTAPAAYPNDTGWMEVGPQGGWYIGVAHMPLGTLLQAVTYDCGTHTFTNNGTDHAALLTHVQFNLFEHDPEGDVIRGTNEQTGPAGYRTISTWDLRRGAQDAELIVEPDAYATWLPEAGADEAAEGNSIAVAARLRAQDGQPVQAARFRFELVDTSREPGVAMNFPRPDVAQATPDLQLTAVTNETARDGEHGQWIEAGAGTDAAVSVTSFDWGGWTTLRVTATLPGGREVVGHLVGQPGQEAIPLPKREPGSLVADAWKAQVGGGADADDTDALPQGDSHDGDGLTLYEEYRGFVENGQHFRADPRRKDLMILNTIGAGATEGIFLFEAASGLTVHHEFTIWEFGPSRVVNTNHAATPHAVDQHGLWLRRLNPGFGEAVGGPGTPRAIQHIDLADLGFGTAVDTSTRRYQLAHVAHELLHGVNVWHHGDRDDWRVRWVPRVGPDGQPVRADDGSFVFRDPTGRDLDVRHEHGGPFVPTLAQLPDIGRPGLEVFVGYDHGQHSGDEACVMRYKVAPVSAESPATTLRYWNATPQPVGLWICDHAAGTGANATGHAPRPRYGAADAASPTGRRARGACSRQICVNDAHTHPN